MKHDSKFLTDAHGRVIEYLRVSVTDRCNLRCTYCMPTGGIEASPRCDILRYKDLLDILEIFASLGVKKVRFTGGEPLVRKGILGFIKQAREIPGIDQIALTTNGTNLARMAPYLKDAGVDRVNVSLDTLRRDRYESITGSDSLDKALAGIRAAMAAGIESVKINMVVMRGVNDDEVKDFAQLSREMKAQIRFLEFMPATSSRWDEEKFMPIDEIKELVDAVDQLIPCAKGEWGGPAQIFKFDRAPGQVGFIAAVTHHFCEECNRLRLTSTGGLVACLFSEESVNLHDMIKQGASRDQIVSAIKEAVAGKNRVRTLPTGLADNLRHTMPSVGG